MRKALILLFTFIFTLIVFKNASALQSTAYNISSITIDGNLNEWGSASSYNVNKVTQGTTENTATFRAMWNNNNLFVAVQVSDNLLVNDSADLFDDDSIEIYIDGLNDKSGPYNSDDKQYVISINKSIVDYGVGITQKSFPVAISRTGNGYILEIGIPFSDIGITASDNKIIGFDIGVNDDDNGGIKDGQISWNGDGTGYMSTAQFGDLVLKGSAKYNVYGQLKDKFLSPVQAIISVDSLTSTTEPNGSYYLSAPSGINNLQYNISNFIIPNFYIKLPSININSDLRDPVNNVTQYTPQNNRFNISFSFDSSKTHLVQTYSIDRPRRVIINGTTATEVSSLSQLRGNNWFYNSTESRIYVNTTSATQQANCGNGQCEFGETQSNCCSDCGCPTGQTCVSNVCQSSSTSYSYIITISGSYYQVLNGTTNAVLYQSTSSSAAFNYLLGSSGIASDGATVYIEAGAYSVPSSWTIYKNSIYITCQSGAVLTKNAGTNDAVIAVYGSNNIIDGITIDGNWLNQSPPASTYLAQSGADSNKVGVLYYGSASNNLIKNSIIHGCRAFGVKGQWDATGGNNGVINSIIYDIGANGLSTAMPAITSNNGDYFVNNEVYNCNDVGIDSYGYNTKITGNYVHDIGTNTAMYGFVNSGWGIAIESGGGTGNGAYVLIAGNTVANCIHGDGNAACGIVVQGSGSLLNVLIVGNTVTNIQSIGISLAGWYGSASNNIVEYNTINTAQYGIRIGSGSSNTIYGINYSNCNTNFYNGGTGTITTPPSITAVTVTSSPEGAGFVTANGVAGYAGSYSRSPYTFYATVGSSVAFVANNVSEHTFISWSDRGAQSHTILVPPSYTTYTATYSA